MYKTYEEAARAALWAAAAQTFVIVKRGDAFFLLPESNALPDEMVLARTAFKPEVISP